MGSGSLLFILVLTCNTCTCYMQNWTGPCGEGRESQGYVFYEDFKDVRRYQSLQDFLILRP